MRLKHSLLLAFIIPSFLYAQDFYKEGYFVVKGQAKNFKEESIDFTLSTYLDHTTGTIRIKPDGSFEQKIPVQHRQKIYLPINNELFSFTVSDEDTLYLNWNDADFKNSFSVKGTEHFRTNELQAELKFKSTLWADWFNLQMVLNENAEKLNFDQKFEMINAAYNQHVKAVFASDKCFSGTGTLSLFIKGLYFQYSKLLSGKHLLPEFKLKLSLDITGAYPCFDPFGLSPDYVTVNGKNVQRSYFDALDLSSDYTLLNDNWFWNIPEYRDFIYDYVRFYKPFRQSLHQSGLPPSANKLFNPTLDYYYLAQVYFDDIGIRDWFITKSIFFGFEHHSFTDVENVYQQFINTCTTPYLKDTLQKYYTAIQRLKPGNPAPEFSLKNDKGKIVSLNDFKGKVVYIDFWGVHCSPCIYDIKNHVPALHKKYKDKDVVFINICVDAEEKEWKKALAKYRLDGINLIAEGWSNNPVCKAYNVNSIPHYILIDKNGNIANNNAPHAFELSNAEPDKNQVDLLLK
jgi:peroxiredoxin